MMMSGDNSTSSRRGESTGLRARRISSQSRESPTGAGSVLSPATGTTELSPVAAVDVVVVVVDPLGKNTTPGLVVVETGLVGADVIALIVVVVFDGAVVEVVGAGDEVVVVVVVVVVGVVVVVAWASTSSGQEWRSISNVMELTSRIAI
jgi:hypothetical protein